jgi:hypothetical protein
MDIHLFSRVLWRFRVVVGAGFVLAVLLAVMTVATLKARPPYLHSRTAPIYSSSAVLLITQPGFPWGSAVQLYTTSSGDGQAPVATGDLTRLTSLANLYVQIANSDVIRALVAKKAPSTVSVLATQNYSVSPSLYSSPLPIITISARSKTKALAIADAQASAKVLVTYLKRQ